MAKVRTRAANRHQAGSQLNTLIDKLGLEVVRVRFGVSTTTILEWRRCSIPVTKCAAVGEFYRESFENVTR